MDREDALRQSRAFTLVELLVVIAVISVLAALLLPTLNNALEGAYKAACANNNRQLYLAWSVYLDDYQGRMPGWESDTIAIANDFRNGDYWRWHTNSALRLFLRNYAGVPVGLQYRDRALDTNSIIFCPSPHAVSTARMSYVCNALGAWTPDLGTGSPLISRMARGGPNGPVVFIQEYIWSASASANVTSEGPHRFTGGYITLADGSLRWHDISEWWSDSYGTSIILPAYRQFGYYNIENQFQMSFNQKYYTTYADSEARSMRRKIWGYRN